MKTKGTLMKVKVWRRVGHCTCVTDTCLLLGSEEEQQRTLRASADIRDVVTCLSTLVCLPGPLAAQ
jgi:hypothetical protein